MHTFVAGRTVFAMLRQPEGAAMTMLRSCCLALVLGYLLGSIPFGLLITRAAGLGDVRKIGSGNIGATNVLRTGQGRSPPRPCCSTRKGTAAVLLARWLRGEHAAMIAGHRAPSSATSSRSGSASRAARASPPISACCSALNWPAGLIFCAVWLGIASPSATPRSPRSPPPRRPIFASIFWRPWLAAAAVVAHGGVVYLQAPGQYRAALAGTEPKIGAEGLSQRWRRRQRLTDRQRLAWLRLIRTDNVGPATFRQLLNRYGSAEAALEALPSCASRAAPRSAAHSLDRPRPRTRSRRRETRRPPGRARRSRTIRRCSATSAGAAARRGARAATASSALQRRRHRRRAQCLAGRHKMTRMLATDLGDAGYVVVSGLARGIDAAAHKASLATGTVAVLAGGLDQIYPPENIRSAEEIVDNGGAAVTEMPLGWEPRARDFPRRNRLVSGISLGLVVVEAASARAR